MSAHVNDSCNAQILQLDLKALSNEIAPNPIIFFAPENLPPIFRKGSVVFWARN
jgi:hypothetical protein